MNVPQFAERWADMGCARRQWNWKTSGYAGIVLILNASCWGQTLSTTPSTASTAPTTQSVTATTPPLSRTELKHLTLDQLMNIQVTSVSREPEKISDSPSAIQVITGEEIQRSGALILPEALQLAPNLQVAQVNAHDWAITARGFNGVENGSALADKLLVMIDGRSVYTPLFGGVYWDVQNVLLQDVDRIEVVSGPGATVWGDNAVNGVINVVTKSAKDTQGLYFMDAAGSWWNDYTAVRYGGQISDDLYYRVYGMGFSHNGTQTTSGTADDDKWWMEQGGFRMDYYPNSQSTFTFQGDDYVGADGQYYVQDLSGGNLLARFRHTFSEKSDLSVQMYYDSTWRETSSPNFYDELRTFDLQAQHRFPLGDIQSITYGIDLRLQEDRDKNVPILSLYPADRSLPLYYGFVQDQITLIPKQLDLTLGSKLEDSFYSGMNWDPSARLAWRPTDRQTVWAAVSRAVRTPTRFEEDEQISTVLSTPDRAFESEKLMAYELGYRIRPIEPLSLSIATFFNHYTDLRSIDTYSSPPPVYYFANNHAADTYGVELSGDLQVVTWWRLRGGYTYLDENVWPTSDAVQSFSESWEVNDPYSQFVIQSMMDLPKHWQLDTVLRYVGAIQSLSVPGYLSLDVRLAWHYRNVELALVGQNLLDNQHPEFGDEEIPRSYYGSVTFRW